MELAFGATDTDSWRRAVCSGCVYDTSGKGSCGVQMTAVHEDNIFSVGRKNSYDQCGRDLNLYIPIINLGEIPIYADC